MAESSTDQLRAYDRNDNFQAAPFILPEPLQVGWPLSGFQQLRPQHKILLPKITREQIEAYFLYRLAGDKQASCDIKALTKGRLMYESKRVLACSLLAKDEIYLSGIVGAAMKNKVSYNYKIKLEKKTGDPLYSHCECPAGKGPHGTCKHLAAVLLLTEEFTSSGNILTEKSCTENIQTFHKPKMEHRGSPIKAEKLPCKRKVREDFFSDPRPEKFRNQGGLNDRVHNIIFNYCSGSSKDISLRYMYGKADIQTAAKDHDYLEVPFTEHWVDYSNKVNENDMCRIESETKGQSSSPKLYAERRWRLTASRFDEIAKATCRRNTSKLCDSLYARNHLNSKAISHGKNYEAKALKAFALKFDVKPIKCGLFVCQDKPFLAASPDALINADSIVEIKCQYNGRNEVIKPGQNFKFLMYDNDNNTVLKPSSNYFDQVQGQMYVTRKYMCYFVVYTLCDLFVQKVEFDEEYCTSCLIPKLELFYHKYYRSYVASKL